MLVSDVKAVDKRRSKIVFEDGFCLVLYNGELRQFDIAIGKELCEEVYHLEIVPKLKKRIRERIVFILKMRDKTEKELREKLCLAGYPSEIVEYGTLWAKKHNFINDSRYLEYYVDSKSHKCSVRKLRFDLKAKGFSEEDIELALDGVKIDEEAHIIELLKKKGYVQGEISPERARKILAFVVRKGYSYAKVVRCMKMEADFYSDAYFEE